MLVEDGAVLAAKLFWPGSLNAGDIVEAKLVSKRSGSKRGVAQTGTGVEILLGNVPPDLTEGVSVQVKITRAPSAERGRLKRAIGQVERQSRDDSLTASERSQYPMPGVGAVRTLPVGQMLDNRWDDVWHAASSGSVDFTGGSILIATTPAMTVVDIDGEGSPRELSFAAIPAIGQALRWFDSGGNIGVDFPTVEAKTDRKAIDAALDIELADWPHERTAMNGFGFVQLVARLEGPSLLHRFATSRTGMCARMAVRQAEMVQGAGATLLTVHPALKTKLKPEWLQELQRRTGREVRIATDPSLALEGAQAQIVER